MRIGRARDRAGTMTAMIDHVIMFRAEGLSNEGSAELMEQLGRLAAVPGVLGFALGKNFGDRSRGFDYCVRVTFADKAALDAYQEHPLHLDVVRYNRAVTDEHICVDFEWDPITLPPSP
jgi:hypothetical protein